ncbi:ABC transporter ATP-binding protein [Streptosporangium sp. NBC_01756]|uniref:ABC transporter ATP-binding protein n=1 Tax=Streptosporangium sp. NBC_01756 TaxID=2975950 RepID=UPI002DDA8CE0|nr:ABC transporter ATP-binding protein [Streptosporangium sp. NBC_01756]WSC89878.1 ABC transporter ATP-binding protein [Streptosporangium sp. NBC_01756]
MDDAVRLESLTKTYGSGDGAVTALRDIRLNFPKGTFTAVMGPSGSGKSTLLQCAAALDRPTSGRVFIDGTDIAGLNETALTELRRESTGFVFQAFNLLPSLTAEQNVALPMRLAGRKPDRRTVQRALAQVGLENKGGSRPGQLSGGQQQRVAVARALVTRPAVLFADEPTGALDLTTGRELLDMLRKLVDSPGDGLTTVVMVTHDPNVASYADRVLFLADGDLVGELISPTPEAVAARMTDLTVSQ